MTRTIIISGADDGYADLLGGLLDSIEAPARRAGVDIGVLDLGMAPSLQSSLRQRGLALVSPDWDYPLGMFRTPPRNIYKAMTARPHLRRYFPGYDVYLWIDADAWVQDWATVELYVDSAQRFEFAVTPEIDRSYHAQFGEFSVLQWRYTCFLKCFGEDVAVKLFQLPMANVGAFAGRADAPHWDAWSETLGKLFARLGEPFFFAEQTALNFLIREGGFRAAFLPATCNWMCNQGLPFCSADGAELLEPNPPFSRIGIVHLTADTKNGRKELRDIEGRTHVRSLRFGGHARAPQPGP